MPTNPEMLEVMMKQHEEHVAASIDRVSQCISDAQDIVTMHFGDEMEPRYTISDVIAVAAMLSARIGNDPK